MENLEISGMNNIDYDEDFSGWAEQQANYIKQQEFSKLSLDHLHEELLDLARKQKEKMQSFIEIIFIHQLKKIYQPHKHTRSWDHSINESSHRCKDILMENPSLKPKIKELIKNAYCYARSRASLETGIDEYEFPSECPWSVKDVFPEIEDKYI